MSVERLWGSTGRLHHKVMFSGAFMNIVEIQALVWTN